MKNLGLYIHIPYCKSKCYYCDFCSVKYTGQSKIYLDRLVEESKTTSRFLNNYNVDTVFIGGGTPTVLPIGELKDAFGKIKRNFNCDINEFTIEANPDTVNKDKLEELKEMGVNRLSIGVQTLNDSLLCTVNRIHTSDEAIKAVELAKKFFDNISVDIMIGLPNQTLKDIDFTINTLVKAGVKHISCYTLQLEDKTVLKKMVENKKISLPDDDKTCDMYEYSYNLLKKLGFNRYEISNFAVDGYESRHNCGYWNRKDYLGLGVSSHSLIENTRFCNTDNISQYINNSKYQNIEKLTKNDILFETVMLGLRTTNGVNLKSFYDNYQIDFLSKYNSQLKKLKRYLNITPENVSIKEHFFEISNSIIVEFLD